MDFDYKTNRIIVDYMLKYYQQSRKTKKPVPKNMWKQITSNINRMLEIKHQNDPSTSNPVKPMQPSELCIHFERFILFQLHRNEMKLTEDEIFTVAYPHVESLKKLQINIVSNSETIFNIDENWLDVLSQIVKYRLNRYDYNYDIWLMFDSLYRMGIRLLEINVENTLLGLNPEEKQQLLLEARKGKKPMYLSKSNKTNIEKRIFTYDTVNDELSTLSNTQLSEEVRQSTVTDKASNLNLTEIDVDLQPQLNVPSDINEDEIIPSSNMLPIQVIPSDIDSQQSNSLAMNIEQNAISQMLVKQKKTAPLVHWSQLFDLYESDVC